jgi:hypothetical protein
MTKVTPAQLNEWRETAGSRYATAIFYSELCHFFATLTLSLGGIACFATVLWSVHLENGWVFGYGLGFLIGCFLTFIALKVTANLILAMVDIAVNSHLQVILQNESD